MKQLQEILKWIFYFILQLINKPNVQVNIPEAVTQETTEMPEIDAKIDSVETIQTIETSVLEKEEVVTEVKLDPLTVNFVNVVGTLPKSTANGVFPKRRLSSISQIVLHHSATTSGTPSAFARFHIQNRKWPGIGYHYVIAKNGTVYQTQDLNTVSNHVQNANTKSVGICFVGNFDIEDPTPFQLHSVRWLIKKINTELKVPLQITKHNQFAKKSCPGTRFEKEYQKLLEDFQKV